MKKIAFLTMISIAGAAALILLSCGSLWCQKTPPSKPPAKTESIGDVVRAEDTAAASQRQVQPPIHILYLHGINQIGAGDSLLLRKGICKYLGECTVTSLGRAYADGPFAADSGPPTLSYMGERIWKSQEEWNASAPFIDRYKITGKGHAPIFLDEINWWPLAYPLKCKFLIAHDALLTGPSKALLKVCATSTVPDSGHANRYLHYQWITASAAADLNHSSRRARILNRSFKSGLMDWGFADAVMALGPMEDVLSAGIRELLIKARQIPATDTQTSQANDVDTDDFFVTHSLGSYLSLVALDSDLLGPPDPELAEFQITPEQRKAADHFSEQTVGFYFLANQLALLQLARVSTSSEGDANPCPSGGGGTPVSPSITHWRCKRELYLAHHGSMVHGPQILAWSDPDDLLSWEVPEIEGVRVVNIRVRNSGFRIPPFLESPAAAHANYAKNREVLRLILKPTPSR